MLAKLLLGIVFSLGAPLALFAQERHYVSYGGTAGFQATVWAMKDLGTFEKYGLNGDVVLVGGSARQIQGVLGGSTDFAQVDITAVVAANLKGADLVVVGGTLNRIPFSMVTQPEIREPNQLRGKKIGVVNFGGVNEYAVLAALNEWGIPSAAATIMPAGGAATRLTAMSAKALDATVLSPPETIKAEKLGLRILLHLSELKTSFPMNVMIVRRRYLEKNRDVVKRMMKAHADAVYQLKHDKKKGMAVLQKRLLQKDTDVIQGTYDYYAPKFEFPPRVNREGAAATAKFVMDRVAAGKGSMDIGKLLDESIVDELEKEGFFKTLAR
ncbi:MAG: ABC transporter substrate-binding protein [Deltaproteobacteria bacterium]|nr:ABC transporter substrate-binding protein [Deltaproteobacteria bacterium]MBI2228124.1 ABC transporter substrate-binding protein [Deltaproteobacteria bacterium]